MSAVPPRVIKPGGHSDKYGSYKTDADVPAHYRNESRFRSLASDPDHGGKIRPTGRAEAMAGLEAEAQRLIKDPIKRGPRGIEFYDVNGKPWDVKAPPSPKVDQSWQFNPEESGKSILKELRRKVYPSGAPPGTFPNDKTELPEKRQVILDSTYLNETDHKALWNWLNQNLTPEELSRIVEVNTRL